MERPYTLLVGLDFSASARRAFDVGTAVAARTGASLRLVHVWNAGLYTDPDDGLLPQPLRWMTERRELLAARLDDWAADAREKGVGETSWEIADGLPSATLAQEARRSKADLLVVGRRGSSNLAHALLGSVSERVLRLAHCPVLVVPEETRDSGMPERLMVAVDFSKASEVAYRVALDIAEGFGSTLGLVLAHARPGEGDRWLEDWSELVNKEPYPYDGVALERWAKRVARGRTPVACRVVDGVPEHALPSAAEREGCDWLVLGLQGRNAIATFLTGSTTQRVLLLTERPVLVVPSTVKVSERQ